MIVRNTPFASHSMQTQNLPNNQNEKVADSAKSTDTQNDKVTNIKKDVENGAYKIDINKTADKMAQDLLLDMKVYR
ncbi:flagellar biosynthesis anti-sigma factor FlgM [Helicobacter sp. 23-1044]